MKGIKKKKLSSKKLHPIWNMKTVFPFIRELYNKKSLLARSQRLALLVLLLGCRRISDVRQFSIAPDFLSHRGQTIFLYQGNQRLVLGQVASRLVFFMLMR